MVRFSIFAKNGTDMEDKLISRYDILVNRYKELVSEKLSRKDFIEYNEILFSAHSCAIEGNSFSVDETRTLKEKGLGMIPKGKTLLEAFETGSFPGL